MAEKHIASWDDLEKAKSDRRLKHYVRFGTEQGIRVVVHKFFAKDMTFDLLKTFYAKIGDHIPKFEKDTTVSLMD